MNFERISRWLENRNGEIKFRFDKGTKMKLLIHLLPLMATYDIGEFIRLSTLCLIVEVAITCLQRSIRHKVIIMNLRQAISLKVILWYDIQDLKHSGSIMRRLIVIEYKYVKVSSVCIKWFSKLRSKLSFNFHTSTIAPNNWGTDPKCKFVFIRKYYSTVEEKWLLFGFLRTTVSVSVCWLL